jgi:1-acyl-sn-glycerol-3-phosphate acyltransferase
MRRLLAFCILSLVKTLSHVFYRGQFTWISDHPQSPWSKAKILVFMNHTSLYEPLFLQGLPFCFLWKIAGHASVPGADITLNRPLVGRFWKLMLPHIASITRKKDSSWANYLDSIHPDSLIIIAPEGRMKRPNGLDKYGRPMTVRGGIADIIEEVDSGGIILCLSGGLHHVQAPGERMPHLFKSIKMNLVYLDVEDFKKQFPGTHRERKIQIVHFFQQQLETKCPEQT